MNWRQLNVRGGEWAAFIIWGVLAIFLGAVFVAHVVESMLGPYSPEMWWVRSSIVFGLDLAILVPLGMTYLKRRSRFHAMTVAEQLAFRQKRDDYWKTVWQLWWVRYLSAGAMVWFAIYSIQTDKKGEGWLFAIGLFIYALIRAREISILVLLVGGAILIFKGVAALPVSVAVIIGALIIASAMKR